MTMIENECSNCMKMVSCKVMTIDTRRGIGSMREHWDLLGGVGGVGAIEGIRGCRGVRGVLGLTGSVGTQGPEGV